MAELGVPEQSGFYWLLYESKWLPVKIMVTDQETFLWYMDQGTIWHLASPGHYVQMQPPPAIEDEP